MDINTLIQKQERGMEILVAIKDFQFRIKLNEDSINGFAGTFPTLRKKYINNIDTLERCIERMYIKFENL